MDIYEVILSTQAERDLIKLPQRVLIKFRGWVDLIGKQGLREARKIQGYHDEPLKGKRRGERSIRLNKAYRAIYIIDAAGQIEIVKVLEINHHDY